ncbi:DUF4186 domain-containing protein [Arboricoccus pini]|nr:DUF4186 domain-containing protein [Arboricoccus pini]
MPEDDVIWARLRASPFRAKFKLSAHDRDYLYAKGLAVVLAHAAEFIDRRLAPGKPARDGRQTPWQGHPVFTAQHATATCCRSCLAKWYGIEKGSALTPADRARVLALIERWLRAQSAGEEAPTARQLDLLGQEPDD